MQAKTLKEFFAISSESSNNGDKKGHETPIKLEYKNLGGKDGLLTLVYPEDGAVIERRLEFNEKQSAPNWSVVFSRSYVADIQNLADEDVSITFKSGAVTIAGKKNSLTITPWNQEAMLLTLTVLDNPKAVLNFNKAGWEHLTAAAEIAKQHIQYPDPKKPVDPILLGVHLTFVEKEVFITAVGKFAICNRNYTMPGTRGRKPANTPKYDESGSFTLPLKAIEIVDSFGVDKKNVSISIGEDKLLIESDKVAVVVELIKGDFPTLDSFHPSSQPPVDVERKELLSAVEKLVAEGEKNKKDALIPIEIICRDSGDIVLEYKAPGAKAPSKSFTISAKAAKPMTAAFQVMGKALLSILKHIVSDHVSFLFPAGKEERLVLEAMGGALYLLTGYVVEAVKYSIDKIQELSTPEPKEEIVHKEETEDGKTVVLTKSEAPVGEPPKTEGSAEQTKAELEKIQKEAENTSKQVDKAVQEAATPDEKKLMQAAKQELDRVLDESKKAQTPEQVKFAIASLFWCNGRVHKLAFKWVEGYVFHISLHPVEELLPQQQQPPTGDNKVLQLVRK
jgi:hypothetical protein